MIGVVLVCASGTGVALVVRTSGDARVLRVVCVISVATGGVVLLFILGLAAQRASANNEQFRCPVDRACAPWTMAYAVIV